MLRGWAPGFFAGLVGHRGWRWRSCGTLVRGGVRYLGISALLAACAAVPDRARPEVRPRLVVVELASQITYAQFSTEELADPATRAAIASCEKQGFSRCHERRKPADSRTQFSRTRDERVFAHVTLGGLHPEQDYECAVRWIGPDGGVRARLARTLRTPAGIPQDFVYNCTFDWRLRDSLTELGRWRVEIAINGQVEGDRSFEVTE